MRPITRTAIATLTLAGLGVMSGCLISSSNTTYESGHRVSENTKRQIELGETTDEWLLATLGPPDSRKTVDEEDNVEIWRYDYSERHESDGAVFLIFAGSTSRSTSTQTYFELTDGVVTKYWSED